MLLPGGRGGGEGSPEVWQWLGWLDWGSANANPLPLICLARQLSQMR